MNWQPFRGNAPATMTIYSASFPDVSDQWPMKDDVTREINAIDKALKADLALLPPLMDYEEGGQAVLISQHIYSEQAYRTRPALAAWRARLVPTALAIFVVQNPLEDKLPEGTPMDKESRQWFIHANDAIGVRSRARVLATLVDKYIHNDIESDWISLASGAAIPVLEALRTAKLDGQNVHLSLVDNDPVALRWAETMAAQEGLNVGEQLTLLRRDLIQTFIRSEDLLLELGEHQAELVDALGIFEYFNDADAVIFLQRALRLVKPGGAVIVSNMLTSSPQIDFTLRCIGWSHIFPRSLEQLQAIHLAAGVPVENVTVIVPKDGVYAVMEMRI
ncbi:class I SAM-dependent methyltransferase [Enterobacter sp. RHBSTW-00994]|uniref:class I SAM-dependent methyltransferase n=1 Tax=Enterobacteriaceae TaxID=543 RepID=UPI0015E9B850|nr:MULTISPECIES: class I SAM-dependent methyltransferase [Enterobacteriaceae]MBM3073966.1 class I SAM-dependent methyltransferase [Lelliottia sp. RWM.1]QLR41233.1 class I SAM-dependent methyltransferase [Enterobacter sp. RHBSTW-00994]